MGEFSFLNMVPGPRKIKRRWLEYKENYYKLHYPQKYADCLYEHIFGYKIDWKRPRDLNEWINYLAFETDTSEWSYLADKYKVREFVASKGLPNSLIPLYGVWDKVEDVDFDSLPESFVIKTNHACGDCIIVRNKAEEDLDGIKSRLRSSLALRFGVDTAEPHYLKIKPLIIAEKLLPPPTNIDYKVWCFYGVPFCIMTIFNRNIEERTYSLSVFDLDWKKHNEWLTPHYQNNSVIPRPDKLEEMLDCARKLSKGFPQVRIDFYNTSEGVFFGEMTFTSAGGRMTYFTKEQLVVMGDEIALKFFERD